MSSLLVLAGSGEFTPAMQDVDKYLLSLLKSKSPLVGILPTAAGRESDYHKWIDDGISHYRKLRVKAVGFEIRNRDDAEDPQWLDLLSDLDFLYLSGGSPIHLLDSLQKTAFWDKILYKFQHGMGLAGSSAGAMVLGQYIPHSIGPFALMDHQPAWQKAFGVSAYSVLPHYDHVPGFLQGWRKRLIKKTPQEVRPTLLGIDEDTALLIRDGKEEVLGRGKITRQPTQ